MFNSKDERSRCDLVRVEIAIGLGELAIALLFGWGGKCDRGWGNVRSHFDLMRDGKMRLPNPPIKPS
jgi:hypothetical protein